MYPIFNAFLPSHLPLLEMDVNKANKRSKFFLDNLGHEGLNKMLDGFDDRSAEAVCTFGFCPAPGAEPILFQGRTEVRLLSDWLRLRLCRRY